MNEVKYKFEPVTNLSTAELIDKYLDGEEFYSQDGGLKYTFDSMYLSTIKRHLKEGKVFRRVECHWTDDLPKRRVVWDDGEKSFSISNLERITNEVNNRYFDDQDYAYQNALPITGKETIDEIEKMIAENEE